MKEELQGKLVEILGSIQTAAGKASDFALEQLPDIAQSYVLYGRAVGTIQLVGMTIVIALLAYVVLAHGFFSKKLDSLGLWADSRIVAVGGGGIGLCCSVVIWLGVLEYVALVWLAPKVWLLKQIATLIK